MSASSSSGTLRRRSSWRPSSSWCERDVLRFLEAVRKQIVRLVALLAALVLFAMPAYAADDSREVAARVAQQWRSGGAKATQLPSRFVFDDETVLVPLDSR